MTRDLALIHLSKADKEVNLGLKNLSHETATTPNEREKKNEVSFSTKTRKHHRREDGKILRIRGWGGLLQNSVLWIWQGHCTHVTEAVAPARDLNKIKMSHTLQHG